MNLASVVLAVIRQICSTLGITFSQSIISLPPKYVAEGYLKLKRTLYVTKLTTPTLS